jgi:hypothetical protein
LFIVPITTQGSPTSWPIGGLGALMGSQAPVQKLHREPYTQEVSVQDCLQNLGGFMPLALGLTSTHEKPSRPQSYPLRHVRIQMRRLPAGIHRADTPSNKPSEHSSSRVHSREHIPPDHPVVASISQVPDIQSALLRQRPSSGELSGVGASAGAVGESTEASPPATSIGGGGLPQATINNAANVLKK